MDIDESRSHVLLSRARKARPKCGYEGSRLLVVDGLFGRHPCRRGCLVQCAWLGATHSTVSRKLHWMVKDLQSVRFVSRKADTGELQ